MHAWQAPFSTWVHLNAHVSAWSRPACSCPAFSSMYVHPADVHACLAISIICLVGICISICHICSVMHTPLITRCTAHPVEPQVHAVMMHACVLALYSICAQGSRASHIRRSTQAHHACNTNPQNESSSLHPPTDCTLSSCALSISACFYFQMLASRVCALAQQDHDSLSSPRLTAPCHTLHGSLSYTPRLTAPCLTPHGTRLSRLVATSLTPHGSLLYGSRSSQPHPRKYDFRSKRQLRNQGFRLGVILRLRLFTCPCHTTS